MGGVEISENLLIRNYGGNKQAVVACIDWLISTCDETSQHGQILIEEYKVLSGIFGHSEGERLHKKGLDTANGYHIDFKSSRHFQYGDCPTVALYPSKRLLDKIYEAKYSNTLVLSWTFEEADYWEELISPTIVEVGTSEDITE